MTTSPESFSTCGVDGVRIVADRLGDPLAPGPMLLVRGQMSDLLTEERAAEFIAHFPEVDFVDVSGAGHIVAGDRNDLFAGAVVEFLARHAEDR
jgi:pimeloyl-ACP methyl ester carboxylesterase